MSKSKMKKLLGCVNCVFSLLVIFSCVSHVNADETLSEVIFTAGIMKRTGSHTTVVKKTNRIPFVTKDEDPYYGFGYKIEFNADQSYRHKVVIRVPAQAKLTGDIPEIINDSDMYRIVSYPSESVSGSHYLFMRLSSEDVSGIYKVETYVNGKLFKVTEFELLDKSD